MNALRVALVTTTFGVIGNDLTNEGIWLEELALPYYAFLKEGTTLTLATVKGGAVPVDATLDRLGDEGIVLRFRQDPQAIELLENTAAIFTIKVDAYDLLFIAGGHGALLDLYHSAALVQLFNDFWMQQKPIGAVESGVAAFLNWKAKDGQPFIRDRKLTGFSNGEVALEDLTYNLPFLLESELLARGASYSRSPHNGPHVVVDGNLVTGQNLASVAEAVKVICLLAAKKLNHKNRGEQS